MNSTNQTTLHKTAKISGGIQVEYVRAIKTRGSTIVGKAMMLNRLDVKAQASLRQEHERTIRRQLA